MIPVLAGEGTKGFPAKRRFARHDDGGVRDVIATPAPTAGSAKIDFVTVASSVLIWSQHHRLDGFIEIFFDSYGDMQRAMGKRGCSAGCSGAARGKTPFLLVTVKKVDTPFHYLGNGLSSACLSCDRRGVDAATFMTFEWYVRRPCW